MSRIQAWLRRDGWLLAVAALCVALCAVASGGEKQSTPEDRLAKVLSGVEGAGRVEVVLHYSPENDAIPTGAVVVADGADDPAVQLRLTRALTTLMQLNARDVEIFKRGGK